MDFLISNIIKFLSLSVSLEKIITLDATYIIVRKKNTKNNFTYQLNV